MCSFFIWVLGIELGSSSTLWTEPSLQPSIAPPRWADLQHACLWRITEETNSSMCIRWVSERKQPFFVLILLFTRAHHLTGLGINLRSSCWHGKTNSPNHLHSSKMEVLDIHSHIESSRSQFWASACHQIKGSFSPANISPVPQSSLLSCHLFHKKCEE